MGLEVLNLRSRGVMGKDLIPVAQQGLYGVSGLRARSLGKNIRKLE